jgi:dTDP-glucose 4,6-dehydratase
MKRLFITGGTGFFGKSMLDYRLRHPEWIWANAEFVVLSRSPEKFIEDFPVLANQRGVSFWAGDIRDFSFPQGRFDAVIHAATSAATPIANDEMVSVIVDGTRHVLDFARSSGCRNVLFTSSGAVYGSRTSPAREDDACNPTTAYGKGKLAAEKMLLESGLDVKIARCFAFVGPYLNRKTHYAIGNFIQDCLDGRDIAVKGDGTPQRSYLYSDDLVEWLFAILEFGRRMRIYNVGSNEAMSIRDLAETVRDVLRPDAHVVVLDQPRSLASVYVPDTSRAMSEMGLRASRGIREAIMLSASKEVQRMWRRVAPSFVSDPSGFVVTLPNLHYAASHGVSMVLAGAKKSSAKRGNGSGAKNSAKSSAIRQGKAAGKNENVIYRSIRDNSHISSASKYRELSLFGGKLVWRL